MKPLLLCIGIALLAAIWMLAASCNRQSGNGEEARERRFVLQRRLEQLGAEADHIDNARALKRLQRAYGDYVDQGMWNQAADLFAPQGTIEIGLDGVYVGQKRIRQYLFALGGGREGLKRGQLNEHIMLQPVVHIAGDGRTAKARWRALIMAGHLGESAFWGEGIYENELIKEEGVWKIKKDHLYTTFFAPYDTGWAMDARPAPKASDKIPPDQPPSETYESFPEVYIPPFHYKNPATDQKSAAKPDSGSLPIPEEVRAAFLRVSAKIQGLEDQSTIENLQRIYGFYVDKQLWKEAADLFADDGTLEIGGQGVFVGKSRVLEYLIRISPNGLTRGKLFNHIQLQPIIDVAPDGNTARGRWRYLSELGDYKRSATWGGGTYENEYVKEGTVWKIKTLHAYSRFCTPCADGWGKSALPSARQEKNLLPDRPPTVSHEPYPATFVAPFHYKNPVTRR